MEVPIYVRGIRVSTKSPQVIPSSLSFSEPTAGLKIVYRIFRFRTPTGQAQTRPSPRFFKLFSLVSACRAHEKTLVLLPQYARAKMGFGLRGSQQCIQIRLWFSNRPDWNRLDKVRI